MGYFALVLSMYVTQIAISGGLSDILGASRMISRQRLCNFSNTNSTDSALTKPLCGPIYILNYFDLYLRLTKNVLNTVLLT